MTITTTVDAGIALVTINRPEKLNALTLTMYQELSQAFDEASRDRDVGVVVLTGAGDRAFCVGADLGESIPALSTGDVDISLWDGAHQKHTTLDKPVICAVNGFCLGAGFEIMLSTDLRVASDTATFALPETGVGVVPAGGTLTRLVRQIPYAAAMELMLLGEPIDAVHAERVGLVNRVVPASDVLPTAYDLARRLLALSGTAVSLVKTSVRALADMPADAAFHAEAAFGQRAFTSADAAEGLAAFGDRRQARFPSRAHLESRLSREAT
ncbi:enoyl-CoA hydratase/isomerase family protein [Nocardioides bigeumensis]|uniref:Enoyl-CoA hydratase-related protein n=1 Tax=Nocardioides bigeumensis TaxID=433657 RepID=A0ABP5JS29_9ACTN